MTCIKNQIANLISDYSINRKYADRAFVEELLNLYISALSIEDYVKNRVIGEGAIERANVAGIYHIKKKSIYIDPSRIVNAILKRIDTETENGLKSTEVEKYLKVNFGLLLVVAHELSHAYEYKKCFEGEDDFEKYLLELSLKGNVMALRGDRLSQEEINYYNTLESIFHDPRCHDNIPSERIANIRSFELERDVSRIISPDIKGNLEDYNEYRFLRCKLEGYLDVSPTAYTLYLIEELKENLGLPHGETDRNIIERMCSEEAKKRGFSLDERIYFGLPLDEEEIIELELEKESIRRRLFI